MVVGKGVSFSDKARQTPLFLLPQEATVSHSGPIFFIGVKKRYGSFFFFLSGKCSSMEPFIVYQKMWKFSQVQFRSGREDEYYKSVSNWL